jgi:exopolysaccharide production protein ExoZ
VRLWSLQALRFFAALAVVHFHAANTAFMVTGDWGAAGAAGSLFGRAGVDVFFVLSGVVITLAARGATAGQFIARRVRRIWPIYLFASAPFVALAVVNGAFGWRAVIASIGLFPVTDTITPPVLPVGWTLCFEVLFYAAAAIVIWRPKTIGVLLTIFLVALIWRQSPLAQFVGNPLVLEFLAGVGIVSAPRWRPAVAGIPIGAAMLLIAVLARWLPPIMPTDLLRGEHGWVHLAAQGVPAALIVWGVLQLDLRPGLLTYLGDASYSLYLTHPLVMLCVMLACRLTHLKPEANLLIVASMLASVVVAWRVHELVEKPLLALFKRRAAPQVQAAA